MAYSKIILNGETLMDVTSDTVDAGNLLSGKTATKNSGAKVTGNIATKSSSDMSKSGLTQVCAPAGFYSTNAYYTVSNETHAVPTINIDSATGTVNATHTLNTGYIITGNNTTNSAYSLSTQAAQTIYPSTSDQTIARYKWLTGSQTIKSVTTTNLTAANIAEGVTVKVGDANNASRITQITGTHSGGIEHTATIYGGGNSTYCYVQHNGIKYYTDETTFTFKEGDTITFFVRGSSDSYITYGDGVIAQATSTAGVSYDYIALGDDLGIYFNYNGSGSQNNIQFYLVNISLENSQVTPTEQYQYINASSAYAIQYITVNPISSTYVGTGVARKSSTDTTFASATGTFTAPIGYYSAAATKTITTQAAQTIYPSTVDQTVASYRWLTGTQTIKSVTTSNLSAENIAEGVVVKVGDANNASRITQVTGTHTGGTQRTFTITGTGTSTACYIQHNNIKYYSAGSFLFKSGDIANLYVYGNSITMRYASVTINGVSVHNAYSTYSSAYTLPDCNIMANLTFGEDYSLSMNYSTINISQNGGYDVCDYGWAHVDVGGFTADDIALRTISGSISGNASAISANAFYGCNNLTYAYFPLVKDIRNGAFYGCGQLSSVVFSSDIGAIGDSAFNNCSALTTAIFSTVVQLGSYVFNNCSNLSIASFDSISKISPYTFQRCYALTNISFPSCVSIMSGAFSYCRTLSVASFPVVRTIYPSAFAYCMNLLSLYLLGSSVPTLSNINAFTTTPISNYTTSTGGVYGSIFVPSSLYSSYLTATNWSVYSARIVSV